MDLKFLKSNRFWKLVIVALLGVLVDFGVLPETWLALQPILLGSVVVRTVDRFGEKVGSK